MNHHCALAAVDAGQRACPIAGTESDVRPSRETREIEIPRGAESLLRKPGAAVAGEVEIAVVRVAHQVVVPVAPNVSKAAETDDEGPRIGGFGVLDVSQATTVVVLPDDMCEPVPWIPRAVVLVRNHVPGRRTHQDRGVKTV